MNTEKKIHRLTLDLTHDLGRRFKMVAVQEGRSMKAIAEDLIRRYVEEKEQGISAPPQPDGA